MSRRGEFGDSVCAHRKLLLRETEEAISCEKGQSRLLHEPGEGSLKRGPRGTSKGNQHRKGGYRGPSSAERKRGWEKDSSPEEKINDEEATRGRTGGER